LISDSGGWNASAGLGMQDASGTASLFLDAL
jgi:hypothetical protein